MRIALAAALIILSWSTPTLAGSPVRGISGVEGMLELKLRGREIEGVPLAWDDSVVHLLGPRRPALVVRPERSDRLSPNRRPISSPFDVANPRDIASGIGEPVRGDRHDALHGGPSPGRARQMGRAVRGSLPIVRPLLFAARLPAYRTPFSADRHRMSRPGRVPPLLGPARPADQSRRVWAITRSGPTGSSFTTSEAVTQTQRTGSRPPRR